MDLILRRILFRQDGILGELTSEEGKYYCSTLEHAYSNDSGFLPKIPNGIYICQRGVHKLSDNKPFQTFEVLNVLGHTGLLFHQGNFNNDSEGCILLGEGSEPSVGQRLMLTNSKNTFQGFMKAQESVEQFALTVIDHTYSDWGTA